MWPLNQTKCFTFQTIGGITLKARAVGTEIISIEAFSIQASRGRECGGEVLSRKGGL